MKELSMLEVSTVSGGGQIDEYYPALFPGEELIGWSAQIIGWESSRQYMPGLFFGGSWVNVEMPIYEFAPIITQKAYTTLVF